MSSIRNLPVIVIGGVPNLYPFMNKYSYFPKILEASTATELRNTLVGPELKGLKPSEIVFIFGDKLVEDDPNLPTVEFIRKLTQASYQVVVISVTPRGAELHRQAPQSVLLSLPIRFNSILYSLNAFNITLEPIANGNEELNLNENHGFGWTALPNTTEQSVQKNNPEQINNEKVTNNFPSNPQQNTTHNNFTPVSTNPVMAQRNEAPLNPPIANNPNTTMPGSNWVPPQRRTLADYAASSQEQTNQAPMAQPNFTQPQTSFPSNPQSSLNANQPAWSPVQQVPMQPTSRYVQQPAYNKPKRRGFVTTISVSKGGTGKSSMTLNLAAFLGMRLRSQGKTVCVIDANTQQSDSGKYLDVYSPNINTIVNDPSLMTEERILAALVHKPEYNLSVLLGPPTPDEANPLAISARLYREILELLKKHYDYIFIDTPVAEKFHEMFAEFALPIADFIVVPVAPNFTTLHNADNWLRAAVTAPRHEGGAGIDKNKIGVVLNRAEDGIGCSEDDVRRTMANWHFVGVIPETKEWKASNNANELVAPKNFANLSHAFAEVLHAATGEPALLENFATFDQPKKKRGFLDFLRNNS